MSITHYHHQTVCLMTLAKSADIASSVYLTDVEHDHPIGHIEALAYALDRFTRYPTINKVLQKDEVMDDRYHDAALTIWEQLQRFVTDQYAHNTVPGHLDRLAILLIGYAVATLARDLSKPSRKYKANKAYIQAVEACHTNCKRYVKIEAKLLDEALGNSAPNRGELKRIAERLIANTMSLITITP